MSLRTDRARRIVRFVTVALGPVLVLVVALQLSQSFVARSSRLRTVTPSFAPALQAVSAPQPSATLSPSRTLTAADAVSGIVDITATGTTLLALSQSASHRLVAIDTRTGRARDLTSILQTAGIESPYSNLWAGLAPGTFFLGSADEARMVKVSLNGSDERKASILRIDRDLGLRYSFETGDARWLSNGYFEDALLRVDNLEHGTSREVSRQEGSLFPDVSERGVAVMLNRNTLALDPLGRHLAQAFYMSSRVHLYDASGALERRIAGPIDIKLNYETRLDDRDGKMKIKVPQDMKLCYIDVTASDRHVVALFSGRAYGAFKDQAFSGDQLHVFTWDGRLVSVLKIDRPVISIAIGEDGQRLWAVQSGEDQRVVEYTLHL